MAKRKKVERKVIDGTCFKKCSGICEKFLQENKNNFKFDEKTAKFTNMCKRCAADMRRGHPPTKRNGKAERKIINGVTFKKCIADCGIFLEENKENFRFRKDMNGFINVCNQCRAKDTREYAKNNIESIKKYKKEYNEINSEKNKKYFSEYHQNNKEYRNKQNAEYRINNKDKRNKNDKMRKENDFIYRLRTNMSKFINSALKNNGGSKNGKSCIDGLGYSIEQLKNHIEKYFEHWMNWNNYGRYIKEGPNKWIDENKSTWKWQIDHIIPHSHLPYDSMDHPNFKKCWALENLRPYSAKQNNLDKNNRSEKQINYIKINLISKK